MNNATPDRPAAQVLSTYVCLKQTIRQLQLREAAVVGQPMRAMYWGWHVHDISPDALEEYASVRDRFKSDLCADSEWPYYRKALGHLSVRHAKLVNALEESCENGTKTEMIEALIQELEHHDQTVYEMELNPIEIDPTDYTRTQPRYTRTQPTNISPTERLQKEISESGPYNWRTQKGVALAEMVGCSKKHAKDVIKRRHELDAETKRSVDKRDGEECVRCSTPDGLVYHHIIPANKGGSSNTENISLLCENCHKKAHDQSWRETVYDSRAEFWQWCDESHNS